MSAADTVACWRRSCGPPSARGVLYDLPEVVSGAPPLLRKLGVAERVHIETGSFFDGVPGGGDAYVLKLVIHDWPDDEAVQICAICIPPAVRTPPCFWSNS